MKTLQSRYLSDAERLIIENLYGSGEHSYEIAATLNRNPVSVQRYLKNRLDIDLQKEGYNRRITKYVFDFEPFRDREFSDYWGGFIAADGCIYKNKGQDRIIINLSEKDRSHLEKFKVGYPVKDGSHDSCSIDIRSDKLSSYLNKVYGVTERKTYTLQYPTNLDNHHNFIRGYFDGDGCFHYSKDRQWRALIIGTEDFLKGVQRFIPCYSAIYSIKNSPIKQLNIVRQKEIIKFIKYIYQDASIFMERKRNLVQHLI